MTDKLEGYPWMPVHVAEDRANEWRDAESFNGEQEVAIVLAAEVRRLARECTRLSAPAAAGQIFCRENIALKRKLARVEALPAWWRKHDKDVWHTDRLDGERCADELEQALKGSE
jgi:hypothetical protein